MLKNLYLIPHVLGLNPERFDIWHSSKNPKGRVPRALPVGEWEIAQRASSEARKVELGATGYARRASTYEDIEYLSYLPPVTMQLCIEEELGWISRQYNSDKFKAIRERYIDIYQQQKLNLVVIKEQN